MWRIFLESRRKETAETERLVGIRLKPAVKGGEKQKGAGNTISKALGAHVKSSVSQ